MYSREQCVEANNAEANVKFDKLCTQLTTISYRRSEENKQYINSLLDEFNALDFKKPIIWSQQKAILVVNQCCTIVPPNYTFLVAKCCQLIDSLVSRQQVKVGGKTFVIAVNWCLQSLVYCADVAVLDILAALSALLRANGHEMEKFNEVFTKKSNLMCLADPDLEAPFLDLKLASLWDIQLSALGCYQAMTVVPTDAKDGEYCGLTLTQLETCSELFLKVLSCDKAPEMDELIYMKMMVVCLQGLENILSQSQPLLEKIIGDCIGCVKAYMLFGLPGHTGLKPQRVFPSLLAQADFRPSSSKGSKNTKVKLRNRKYSRKSDVSNDNWKDYSGNLSDNVTSVEGEETNTAPSLYPTWLKTSESEYSDTETGQATKSRVFQGRVRQAALCLLQIIVKLLDKKLLFGYLSSLLPDGSKTPQTRTLVTCLLRDPSPRCRMEVLNVLTTLLSGSKMYFLQAENSEKTLTSFTPYSITLGNMLKELHQSLRLALSAENSVPVIVHMLKVFVRLVQNSPYHKLNTGLISKIVRSVRPFLRHKDGTVQVAGLSVMRAVISTNPSVPEIAEILNKPYMTRINDDANISPPHTNKKSQLSVGPGDDRDSETETDSVYEYESDNDEITGEPQASSELCISWLLETCLEKLGVNCRKEENSTVSVAPVPVRVESLQLLSLIIKTFYNLLVAPHINYIIQVIEVGLMDLDPAIPLHSGRLTEALTYAVQLTVTEEKENFSQIKTVTGLWKMMIDGPITFLIQNPGDAALRYTGCDCLANMTAEIFEQLSREKQIFLVTLLFGCSSDEKGSVRASAIRALSTYVLFPSLREDIHFVIDTSECILKSLHDSNILTRVRVSWSLSNLSEALLLNVSDSEVEKIPNDLFSQLLESSIKASSDSEKVRLNSVRALGNFLRILDSDRLADDSIKNNVPQAINTLVKNASTGNLTKVRWNACYALGNAMKNPILYLDSMKWQAAVFSTLNELVQNYRNFKVRISAASALSAPSTRQQYGNHFLGLWTVLMNALDNSQNMVDFAEYQHRDNLVDQICLTLIHMASLVSESDLVPLQDVLVFHADTLQQHLLRFQQRVVPEKVATLVETSALISSLFQISSLTEDQRRSATLLNRIFVLNSDISLF